MIQLAASDVADHSFALLGGPAHVERPVNEYDVDYSSEIPIVDAVDWKRNAW